MTASLEGTVSCDCLGRGTPGTGSLLLIGDERGWGKEGLIYYCFSFSTCLSIQLRSGTARAIPQDSLCTRKSRRHPASSQEALQSSQCITVSSPMGWGSLSICKTLINTREAFPSDSVCCVLKGDAHLSKGNALSGKTPMWGKAIRSCQHGFTDRKSCLTNPIAFCSETTAWMDEGRAVLCTWTSARL